MPSITTARDLGLGLLSAGKSSACTRDASGCPSEPGQAARLPLRCRLTRWPSCWLRWSRNNDRLRTSVCAGASGAYTTLVPPRGNWKQTWQQCLEILRRCIYLDKDLVLPAMGTSGGCRNVFCGGFHGHAAIRNYDGAYSRTTGTRA